MSACLFRAADTQPRVGLCQLNVQTSHLRRLLPATSVSIVNIKKRGYVLQVALARRTHHVPHQTFGLTRFSSPSIGELKRGASE